MTSDCLRHQVPEHRSAIVSAEALSPLIELLVSNELGTPEAAARALTHLARADGEQQTASPASPASPGTAGGMSPAVPRTASFRRTSSEISSEISAELILGEQGGVDEEGAAWRKASIDNASGVKWLVHMLDGSNLSKGKHLLKPPAVGGWPSLRVGIVSCHETEEIFPGSNVDFGAKIGMQEQAAVRAAAEDF